MFLECSLNVVCAKANAAKMLEKLPVKSRALMEQAMDPTILGQIVDHMQDLEAGTLVARLY
eukprot:5755762-Pyramimonas_sp.AAC.1